MLSFDAVKILFYFCLNKAILVILLCENKIKKSNFLT